MFNLSCWVRSLRWLLTWENGRSLQSSCFDTNTRECEY
jgi:hypothetical protein